MGAADEVERRLGARTLPREVERRSGAWVRPMRSSGGSATFETQGGERSRVVGSLDFETVANVLPLGSAAIAGGHAAVIDLSGVTASDSSGLALLIEWMSVAKEGGHSLRYDNMPPQLQQLARLSEVDELLITERLGREAG